MTGKRVDVVCVGCGKVFSAKMSTTTHCKRCLAERRMIITEEAKMARYTIFLRDDFKCVYCGQSSIEDGVKLVLDHVIPYSTEKNNSIYNLITSCVKCNMTKVTHPLPLSVYNRIAERNIIRNKGISASKKKELDNILNNWFTLQKLGTIEGVIIDPIFLSDMKSNEPPPIKFHRKVKIKKRSAKRPAIKDKKPQIGGEKYSIRMKKVVEALKSKRRTPSQ
jgi:hypothetical protein